MKIGAAKVQNGLYLLDNVQALIASKKQPAKTQAKSPKQSDIWLHHRCLDHLHFGSLKAMFPSLFLHVSSTDFRSEVCELAKHHRVSFPPSSIKTSASFDLIHSNVWDPSKVSNLNGVRGSLLLLMTILESLGYFC